VDTGNTNLSVEMIKYRWRKKLRYKGTFIAPDGSGQWVPYHPFPPHDWTSSIEEKSWIPEIANTSRRIAEREKSAVSVMWFIDNDPRATPHRVLPWYHGKAELGIPKAAPRKKIRTSSDFMIRTNEDWATLNSVIQSGRKVERIMLEPTDPDLVRNQEFARELAAFAAVNSIVVELAGGILSHAYYQLRRHGAQVECVDLFGTDEDKVEYNKLVRDKIPGIIKNKGESADVVVLSGEALMTALREKLVEEAYEAVDAKSGDELIGELADVLDVINGVCDAIGIPFRQVTAEQRDKRRRRGAFRSGVMLRRTVSAHSLPKTQDPSAELPIELMTPNVTIENPNLMPRAPIYRRPDLRQVDQSIEKILTFETQLSKLGSIEQATILEIPLDGDISQTFKLTIEITRNGSGLWTQARLRLVPSQMAMKLEASGQMKIEFSADEGSLK
jgi:predicted house-cleaning noncanonical NTP pyrophosphatase (MazG superfamily)